GRSRPPVSGTTEGSTNAGSDDGSLVDTVERRRCTTILGGGAPPATSRKTTISVGTRHAATPARSGSRRSRRLPRFPRDAARFARRERLIMRGYYTDVR